MEQAEEIVPPEGPRKMRLRPVTLKLPEPYADFTVVANVNYPQKRIAAASLAARLRAEEYDNDGVERSQRDLQGIAAELKAMVSAACADVIVSHDLCDFDGEPYPPASDPVAFWAAVDEEEIEGVLWSTINEQRGKLTPPKPVR